MFDNVHTGESGGHLIAWEKATGKPLWSLETGGHLGAAAAIGIHGELFIGDRRGKLFKLS